MNHKLLLSLTLLLAGCSNGSGGLNPQPNPAQFVYVLNSAENSISQFKVKASGELAAIAPAVATEDYPRIMVMDKVHNTVYTANLGSSSISQFTISANGSLKPLAPSVSVGAIPEGLVIGPGSRYVYSLNASDNTISQYTVATDGALTLKATIPHADGPVAMAFSPSGGFAYVVNDAIDEISQYAVDSDGSLTALNPATVASSGCPSGPIASATSQNGSEHVYVLSCITDEVEVFAIADDGTLSSQQTIKTGVMPSGFAISGSNMYVTNVGDATVSMYGIQADGTLQALLQPTVSAGIQPESVAVNTTGSFAYVLDSAEDKIISFARNLTGELSPSTKGTAVSGAGSIQIVVK
ncbi:beta-propeller fold lactonase family protein [Bdellovibrio sp. 22V]|uniref:lactonase family protein n=1 Tax=Bdellovibrio TaxID=958 RepID=UPI0025429172|nr:beta-propeller fold lactonase family protein [Bdellovibrio sp. 22V]WII72363.1 beta-propeller fold lactonase family protein [Bdellovibrio sp. 22V]